MSAGVLTISLDETLPYRYLGTSIQVAEFSEVGTNAQAGELNFLPKYQIFVKQPENSFMSFIRALTFFRGHTRDFIP